MYMFMTPGLTHSYYLTQRQRVIELNWPAPPKKPGISLKGRLMRLLHGGPPHDSPEQCITPEDFESAVKVLNRQDVELAITAFTGLGYEVTVRTLR